MRAAACSCISIDACLLTKLVLDFAVMNVGCMLKRTQMAFVHRMCCFEAASDILHWKQCHALIARKHTSSDGYERHTGTCCSFSAS